MTLRPMPVSVKARSKQVGVGITAAVAVRGNSSLESVKATDIIEPQRTF